MGWNSGATLSYGYHLGSPESEYGWAFLEVDENGDWKPSWTTDDDPMDGINTYMLAAVDYNPAAVQWPNRAEDPEGWQATRDRLTAAQTEMGCEIIVTGHSDNGSGYILAAHQVEVEWAAVAPIDFADLDSQRVAGDWDAKLARMIRHLGITPVDLGWTETEYGEFAGRERKPVEPSWILSAYYT
jgi:hypothetical protein